MIKRRKRIEVYNCVCSTVIGYYVGVLLGVIPGGGKGWGEITHVGMVPGGSPMASMGNSNDLRGRV